MHAHTHTPGLDTLRALAAIAVLLAHGGYFLFAALPIYDLYAFAGWLGTELFFTLAGYLLTTRLLDRPPPTMRDITRWWLWRAWRILPLFWCALALHVTLSMLAKTPAGIEAASFIPLAQNLAWTHPAWFGEAWNLPVLMLFFLAAPVAVALLRLHPGDTHRLQRAALIALMLAIAARCIWVWTTDPAWDAGVRKIVLPRLDACLYGALLACIVHRAGNNLFARTTQTHRRATAAVAWIAAATAFALLPRDTSDLARIGLFVLSGIAGACTIAAFLDAHPTPTPLAALARWSYPLYLLNMPVLIAMAMFGFGQTADIPNALLRFIWWLVASIALAALVYRLVERPLLRARARRLVAPAGSAAHADAHDARDTPSSR